MAELMKNKYYNYNSLHELALRIKAVSLGKQLPTDYEQVEKLFVLPFGPTCPDVDKA